MVDHETVPVESCRNEDGTWTKFILERYEGEERAAILEFIELCDTNITTKDLSLDHKIRFITANKFRLEESFTSLVASERIRYEMGCETLTA